MIENNELFNELKKVLCKHLYNNDLFYLINEIFDTFLIHFWWDHDRFGNIQISYMKLKKLQLRRMDLGTSVIKPILLSKSHI